uniref:RING finger protein 207 n=1 Tax=Elaeophora elaphi TaxID=1147741 RepID=A0A158Q8V2_9BILA
MACSSSLLMFKLENVESRNPLECLICDREFSSPVRLPCQHNYCRECIENRKTCPVCGTAIDGEVCPDNLLSFLIDTSHETADVCANCDQISQPMHFCETCQQALCNLCRHSTHQARMFATHRVVPLEERARVKGRMTCPTHGEPYILYSMENRNLACIVCFNNADFDSRHHLVQIDAAHKMGCEKLDKATVKLRAFQDDVAEQLQLRKRLVSELAESHRVACESIRQTCQEMTDTLLTVRDRLLKKLDEEMATRIQHFREQMRQLTSLQPTTRLCLLSASIFCSSASKLDFLQCCTDLLKRIQSLISMRCEKPQYTGDLTVDTREEFNRALEPFLGLSSFLLCTSVNNSNDGNERSCGTASPRNSFGRRSGSSVVNGCQLLLSKYQLVVDLAGAFGEQFTRVETPLQQYSHEMTELGKKVQELQRDLTLRRCIIEKDSMIDLIRRCKDLDARVGQHSSLVNDLQPQLQQIWQEELDRVRRQQVLFREKIEEIITLREKARHIVNAAEQLEPYAICLAAVTSVIDHKRCHKPDPAPMETICQQINTLEPDSQQRIEAIEKEEQNRRLVQDQKKREEQMKIAAVKKSLKATKEQKRLLRKSTNDNSRSSRPPLVNMTRDRSRGGTDRALLSPCQRRRKGWVTGSRSQSDADEMEILLDISFEFFAKSPTAEAELTKVEYEYRFCRSQSFHRSSLLPTVSLFEHEDAVPSSSSSLLNDNHISKHTSDADLRRKSGDIVIHCEERNETTGSKIPEVPFVPRTIFANLNSPNTTLGTYEVREKVLESLKQRIPLVDACAQFEIAEHDAENTVMQKL